ncbi:MAG: hypothetical protein MPK11_08430 [Gammaproteobacteria bacterium]|nr:hypothetical protein [Gammaproteobacteria bacterium]MDA7961816.1 hypothetical protein [Gammaproteobacteria bacterium]MDA7970777.1 hypothetical protein [Gammaproteobacteria bacterium]MDA8024433.1 hypothetical protein [Gammaproteobacteria bacterium]
MSGKFFICRWCLRGEPRDKCNHTQNAGKTLNPPGFSGAFFGEFGGGHLNAREFPQNRKSRQKPRLTRIFPIPEKSPEKPGKNPGRNGKMECGGAVWRMFFGVKNPLKPASERLKTDGHLSARMERREVAFNLA